MKRYLEFITESLKPLEIEWFNAIRDEKISKIKNLISRGIDINIQKDNGITALMVAAVNDYIKIVELLLSQPKIDVNIQSENGKSALSIAAYMNNTKTVMLLLKHPDIDIEGKNLINTLKDNTEFLKDYDLQKTILLNGRTDIILYLNKYGLVNPKIKEENRDLFSASDWGLISR